MVRHRAALVERPVACSGRGQYMALVYYGSEGGALYHKVFKYSHKDPRQKGEAAVLRDITEAIPAKHRNFIVAISVVKRCLHPKSQDVPKVDRLPHFERVFAWVVQHDNSIQLSSQVAIDERLQKLLQGHRVQAVALPYTQHELRELPVKDVVTTNYWRDSYAAVSLRGVERIVDLHELTSA